MKKRLIIFVLLLPAFIAILLFAWFQMAGMIQRPAFAVIGFSDSNNVVWQKTSTISECEISTFSLKQLEEISLKKYDVILLRTIGWKPSESELLKLERYRRSGKIIALPMSIDLSIRLTNIPENITDKVGDYMAYPTTVNYDAVLKILLNTFCSKNLTVPLPEKLPEAGYFHLGSRIDLTLADFERRCKEEKLHHPFPSQRIALIGSFLDPVKEIDRIPQDEFIRQLSEKGYNVYPIYGFNNNPQLLIDVKPDLVVYFPRGRVLKGDKGAEILKKLNVPVLTAVHLSVTEKEWREEPIGMTGSYYALATALPELDGVIEPAAISTKDMNEQGLVVRCPLTERIDSLVERIDKWLTLQRLQNKDKKVAVFYYKAPGNAALVAQSLEVVDSLYNFLVTLKQEGYDLGNDFPESKEALEKLINQKGKTIGQWAIGSLEKFIEEGTPEIIPATTYRDWFKKYIPPKMQKEVLKYWGQIPGKYMVFEKDDIPNLLIGRIELGNIVLLPQPTVEVVGHESHAANHNDINLVHGTHKAPPHFYLAAYLWAEHVFAANALVHFGTHGSLEFTPGKSAMMSENCWPDILIGDIPNIYLYSINNIGESLLAKRRTRAVTVSHLTPPFRQSGLYGDLSSLDTKIHDCLETEEPLLKEEYLVSIKELVEKTGLLKDIINNPDYKSFAEYTSPADWKNNTKAITQGQLDDLHHYLHHLESEAVTNGLHVLGRRWTDKQYQETARLMAGDPAENEKNLRASHQAELDGLVNALAGRFIAPSSGGDVLINSASAPSGRNLAGMNVEVTPGQEVERVAAKLTEEFLQQYRNRNNGEWPHRVALTLWGGEYIRTKGVTVAQAFSLLGVRPVRDSRGVIQKVEIIPSEELKRPRIDIVAQTSGQFRDAMGSRIELIDQAVQLVAALPDEKFPNYIKENGEETAKELTKQGMREEEVTEWKTARIFGSPNAVHYGTGIMHLIERGDQWNSEADIADQYLANMSGVYRNGRVWGKPVKQLLESNLRGTSVILQSRSSNTWGPVKLDHIYEFNTLALAVRKKTGKDPQILFSDFRRPGRAVLQSAESALREELRTTLWNPEYLKGLQKEGATAATSLAKTVRNLYGWNVVQPDTVDSALWDETVQVLIEDRYHLGLRKWFEEKSPAALQDMTAVMLETIRKGYWKPSEEVVKQLSKIHAELVRDKGAACSYETCANKEFHRFLSQNIDAELKAAWKKHLEAATKSVQPLPQVEGIELEESAEKQADPRKDTPPDSKPTSPVAVGLMILAILTIIASGYFVNILRRD